MAQVVVAEVRGYLCDPINTTRQCCSDQRCSHRLVVRSPPFQGGSTGSNPVGSTKSKLRATLSSSVKQKSAIVRGFLCFYSSLPFSILQPVSLNCPLCCPLGQSKGVQRTMLCSFLGLHHAASSPFLSS